MRDSSHKAIGGALGGLVTTLVAVAVPWWSGAEIDPGAVTELRNAVLAVIVLAANGLFGFLMTYYAPKNRTHGA